MQKSLLQLSLLSSIWLRIHDDGLGVDKLDAVLKERCDKLRLDSRLAAIPDKDCIFAQVRDMASELCTSEACDSTFFAHVSRLTQGWDDAICNDFAATFMALVMEDGKISPREQECMAMLAAHMGRGQDFLAIQAPEQAKTENREGVPEPQNKKVSLPLRISAWVSLLLSMAMIALLAWGTMLFFLEESDLSAKGTLKELKSMNAIVVKQVRFSKFLIVGTPKGTNTMLDKLNIFLVNGEADIQFNLSAIGVDVQASSVADRRIVLQVPSFFPEVEVRINPQETHELPGIAPEPVTEDQAEAVAKVTGIVGGAASSVIGAKLGSAIGLAAGGNIGQLVGGVLGATATGGGAGYATYVATRNFLTGLELANNTLGDKEEVLNRAKPIIRLELMGSGFFDRDNWQEDLEKYYRGELESRLRELLQTLGWIDIRIVEKN